MKQLIILIGFVFSQLLLVAQADSPKQIVFSKVQSEPEFEGGQSAWRSFLKSNLKAGVPFANRAPAGRYTVIICFIVNTDGSLTDIEAETKHGYGMEKEAIRVLKLSPAWRPAMQDDKPIKARRRQPFVFAVSESW